MEEDKWERYERERVQIQPETQELLEQMMTALLMGSVDATVRLLLLTRTFSLQVASMVETVQQRWQLSESLEVVAELVRQPLDREEHDASLLTLMEELEVSGVADPVAYLAGLVRKERPQREVSEALVDYQMVPYSRLVGIHTPAAMRERWRRAIWTIMMHNRACKRADDRWYINVWPWQLWLEDRSFVNIDIFYLSSISIQEYSLTSEMRSHHRACGRTKICFTRPF